MKLTYSKVVSTLALVFAIGGGTVYAANEMIGSNDIKRNAVQSSHIDKNAVLGKDVKESSLGTVPEAKALSKLTIEPINVSLVADNNGPEVPVASLNGQEIVAFCEVPPQGGVSILAPDGEEGLWVSTDLRSGTPDELAPEFFVGGGGIGAGSEQLVAGSITLYDDQQVVRADLTGTFENGVGGDDHCSVTGTVTSYDR